MKRRLLAIILALVLVFSLCSCTADAGTGSNSSGGTVENKDVPQNEKIADEIVERGYLVVGCKMDVPNLGYYDLANDEWSGLEVELAYKTAGNLFGVSELEAKEKGLVHFVGVTVEDREDKLSNGEIDIMIATYTITDARREKFAFSDSYYTDYIGIMVRKSAEDNESLGNSGIRSVADLDGVYVGVPRNATTRDEFIKYISTMNTVSVSPIFCEFASYEQLFSALKNGNIDAMAVDVSILNGYVDDSTEILGTRFGGQKYGAAVKLENQKLLEYVNQAVMN